DLSVDRGRAVGRSIACTSNRFCNYSVAETKDKLDEVLGLLTRRHGRERIGDLAIHLDGCPHACAQHWIGEIGLQGTTTNIEGSAERVEAYDLTVGGGLGRRTAIGRRLLRRVPGHEVGEVVDRLVAAWLAESTDGTARFGDFCDAHSDEELLAIAIDSPVADPGGADAALVSVLVPGPLQRLVGGADELAVPGATVGEVLGAVAAEHPEFGTTVLPDGAVAGAFLVTVADDDIRNRDGLATTVAPGDVITIVMAMAGG
ncbi:MAG TPA: MoaD/ThiS family protein, partial [Marmoricola sp.]|nr:MoaD/ThiS family protein [Marmoricola sp.]